MIICTTIKLSLIYIFKIAEDEKMPNDKDSRVLNIRNPDCDLADCPTDERCKGGWEYNRKETGTWTPHPPMKLKCQGKSLIYR